MNKRRSLLAPWIWITYAVLFTLAVPWYWAPDNDSVWLGFPRWVVVSIAISFVISAFTAWVFVTKWPQDEEGEP